MKLVELSSPKIKKLAPDTPVVIPIAAIEQHGEHLPVWTDSLLLGEIIERLDRRMQNEVLFAPLMWLGNSDHHLDFCGTLSASPRVYLDMLGDLVRNFLHHGFRRIVFLNGHGGNDIPGKQAIFEVRQQYRTRTDLLLAFATYWSFESEPWNELPTIEQREMGHACEWETSMVLAINPALVGEYKNAPVIEPGNPFRPASRGWITNDRSSIGHIGWPHLASAEKGEVLFKTFSHDIEAWLRRVIAWDGKSWEG